MKNKISKKIIYRVEFELASPMSVGSGDNEYTDKDIIKDRKGVPFIPASSIAGVCRELLGRKDMQNDPYFGYVVINTKTRKDNQDPDASVQQDSRISFFDARVLDTKGVVVSKRDSVALDEHKTAKKGAKFDMEILEPGVTFATYILQDVTVEQPEELIHDIVALFASDRFLLGTKTMRGYGAITNVKAGKREFDLQKETDARAFVDFDMFSAAFTMEEIELNGGRSLELGLKLKGGIAIRRYTTAVEKEKVLPDFEQLTVQMQDEDGKKVERPTVPGTSWAGAIEHRVKKLAPQEDWDTVFESVKESGKMKSQIRFSESVIKGARAKVLSRNAIDRFSGGTAIGALFTEKTYYGGTTTLRISFKNMTDTQRRALAAALTDLHMGFLAVGGETSIGRGLFEITKVNGQPTEGLIAEEVYNLIDQKLKELEKEA